MKRIACLLAILLLPGSYFAQGLPQLYKEVSSSVVYIRIVNVSQGLTAQGVELMANEASGSGVLVSDDGLIWTAAHVVQSAELVKVEFQDGQSY